MALSHTVTRLVQCERKAAVAEYIALSGNKRKAVGGGSDPLLAGAAEV